MLSPKASSTKLRREDNTAEKDARARLRRAMRHRKPWRVPGLGGLAAVAVVAAAVGLLKLNAISAPPEDSSIAAVPNSPQEDCAPGADCGRPTDSIAGKREEPLATQPPFDAGAAPVASTASSVTPAAPPTVEVKSEPAPPPPTPQAEPPAPATPPPPAANSQTEETRLFADKARDFIAGGDITTARLFLERAADRGDAAAMFALAETYDPHVLDRWKARGVEADPEKAWRLYAQALTAGVREAGQRLSELAVK